MLSYNSIYIPGYTGFIPNLENVIGETYGNATRKLLMQQAKLLRSRHTVAGVPGHKYLLGRTFGQPYEYAQLAQDRNAIYEYRHSNGCPLAQRCTCDIDPQTTSAFQSTAKTKADLKVAPKSSESRQLIQTKPGDKTSKIPSSARPSLSPDRNISERTSGTTIPKAPNPEETLTSVSKNRGNIQKRQGKLIYQADCGLLPNYTGYIPGYKFSFGKTWGASTRKSLEMGKRRPFLWTSFM